MRNAIGPTMYKEPRMEVLIQPSVTRCTIASIRE